MNPIHLLATFRGVLGSTVPAAQETWSFGLRFAEEGSTTGGHPAPTQALADMMADKASTFIAGSANFCTYVHFTEVRLYTIGTDGRATEEPKIAEPLDFINGASGQFLPYQCSQVVSFTANGLGKGKRGRIYLPPQGMLPAADGLITTAHQTATSNAVTSFINTIVNDALLTAPSKLVIIGRTGGAGTMRAVDHVSVGRVIDTQRRRRRSLVESHVENITYADYQLVG